MIFTQPESDVHISNFGVDKCWTLARAIATLVWKAHHRIQWRSHRPCRQSPTLAGQLQYSFQYSLDGQCLFVYGWWWLIRNFVRQFVFEVGVKTNVCLIMRPGRRRPAQAEGQRRVAWFNEGGCWPTKHPIWWECNWFLNILDPIYRRGHGASNCWKNKLLPASILPWREKKKTWDALAVMRQFFLKSEDKPKEKEVEEWICGCHNNT